MVRACCIKDCRSGWEVPSHLFPKNPQRCKQWLQALQMNITDENEIKRLRVCHKHFAETDYSCSPTIRRLLSNAIPQILLESEEEQQERIEMLQEQQNEIHKEQEEQQERIEILQEQQNEMHKEQEEQQERIEMFEEQQVEVRKEQQEQQERIEMFEEQHVDIVCKEQQEQQERIEMLQAQQEEIQKQLMRFRQRRPNLQEITRKKSLPIQVKPFYNRIIKLQKEKSRLKKVVKRLKEDKCRHQKLIISTADYKGNSDKTALVRQQIIDMISRNDQVAP